MHYSNMWSNADGSQKKIPAITRLPSGRYRARSRRKGYPIDSKVFDSMADAAEWKSASDTNKRHGIYRDTKEAENTTLGHALREYLVHVVEAKKSKTKVNGRNHIRQILTDRISDYRQDYTEKLYIPERFCKFYFGFCLIVQVLKKMVTVMDER